MHSLRLQHCGVAQALDEGDNGSKGPSVYSWSPQTQRHEVEQKKTTRLQCAYVRISFPRPPRILEHGRGDMRNHYQIMTREIYPVGSTFGPGPIPCAEDG